jgi:integrase
MVRSSRRTRSRKRIGRVSVYLHHNAWWLYFRQHGRPVRRRVAEALVDAERIAAEINAQLAAGTHGQFSFEPITVSALRAKFLAHHELVLRSSVNTLRRYRAATQHLENFTANSPVHELSADEFAAHLRRIEVAPNGHANSKRRPLRGRGVQFILETCRSLVAYGQRLRHLPPYAANPFSGLRLDQFCRDEIRSIFIFDESSERQFLTATSATDFPVHFLLAKTGLRPGELVHLLIDDLDLERQQLHVRNKPELGWSVKSRSERCIPLIAEAAAVLEQLTRGRQDGPVFLRPVFSRATCRS